MSRSGNLISIVNKLLAFGYGNPSRDLLLRSSSPFPITPEKGIADVHLCRTHGMMAIRPACGHRESSNPPYPVTVYLDWRQYKQFSHSDPERISCFRYSGYVAGAVAWDSVLLGLVVLSGRGGGGGGSGDLPIFFPPVTTEITVSFCNDSGKVIDTHRVLRGSNTWTETFHDDHVHMYLDIDSPRLVKTTSSSRLSTCCRPWVSIK